MVWLNSSTAALCAALALGGSQQLAAQTGAEVLSAARAAIGRGEPREISALAVWGAHQRGGQTTVMALSLDLAGKYLEEHTTYSTTGEVQRMGVGEDGAAAVSGGMPGDSGGPALNAGITECLNGPEYWMKTAVGGRGSAASDARRMTVRRIFARYALAFTLSPPKTFPVGFVYGGRMETSDGLVDVLSGTGPEDFQVRLFVDTKTHLPVMMQYVSTQQGTQDMQLWLRDYRVEDGLLMPHDLTWFADGKLAEEFQVQHVKLNPRFPAQKFQK